MNYDALGPSISSNPVHAIIDDLAPAPAVAPPTEKEKYEDPAEFKFSGAKDKVGLPMEHQAYADKNCKTCYGSGKMRLVIVDGSVGVVFDDSKKRVVKNPKRKIAACNCMNKAYNRIRKQWEVDLDALAVEGKSAEEAREFLYQEKYSFLAPAPPSTTFYTDL